MNQPDLDGDDRVDLAGGADRQLVRRDSGAVGIERLAAGTFAPLRSLASGGSLKLAVEAAKAAGLAVDFGTALSAHVGAGTLARIDPPSVR